MKCDLLCSLQKSIKKHIKKKCNYIAHKCIKIIGAVIKQETKVKYLKFFWPIQNLHKSFGSTSRRACRVGMRIRFRREFGTWLVILRPHESYNDASASYIIYYLHILLFTNKLLFIYGAILSFELTTVI